MESSMKKEENLPDNLKDNSERVPLITVEIKKDKLSRQTIRDVATISTLWVAYLIVSAGYSIIAPFYPQEVGND